MTPNNLFQIQYYKVCLVLFKKDNLMRLQKTINSSIMNFIFLVIKHNLVFLKILPTTTEENHKWRRNTLLQKVNILSSHLRFNVVTNFITVKCI